MAAVVQENQNDGSGAGGSNNAAGIAATADYEVGYKRPPRHSRFKPGQSGNPKGRPKGTPNHRITVNRVLNEKVVVHEGNKTRSVGKFEAMVQAQMVKAMKGDARAAGMILNLIKGAGLLSEENAVNDFQQKAKEANPGEVLFEQIDPAFISDDELIELSRLAETVDAGGGITALNTSEFERLKQITDKGCRANRAAA
jgi:Family of unknown function (DUF5681)